MDASGLQSCRSTVSPPRHALFSQFAMHMCSCCRQQPSGGMFAVPGQIDICRCRLQKRPSLTHSRRPAGNRGGEGSGRAERVNTGSPTEIKVRRHVALGEETNALPPGNNWPDPRTPISPPLIKRALDLDWTNERCTYMYGWMDSVSLEEVASNTSWYRDSRY